MGSTDDTQVVPGDDPLTGASTIVAPPSVTHDGEFASAGTILRTEGGASSTQQRPAAEASSSGSGPRRLAPGTRIGRYSLAEPLGAGGMGVVYRAHDPELERQIAIKVLRSDRADGGRFLREAQAMAKLSHPNVVPIHDVGRWDSGLFLAMELIEGETLRKWLQGAVRGWREVAEMFVQAGRGLAEAHAAGIVHREHKPPPRNPAPNTGAPPISSDPAELRGRGLPRVAPRRPEFPAPVAKRWQWQRADRRATSSSKPQSAANSSMRRSRPST